MEKLNIHLYGYLSDNYGVLLHDNASGKTACIDTGDAKATLTELENLGWNLDEIWVTHHHADHTAGVAEVKSATGATVIGPATKPQPIKSTDKTVAGGDTLSFAGRQVNVIHTPGHTLDMINFHLPDEKILFSGDTLFTLGCGRLFEGTAEQMHESLSTLMSLPGDTKVYSSHEYTIANAKFALSVDPDNTTLKKRFEHVKQLVSSGQATIPSTVADELETNPFVRANDTAIRTHLNMTDDSEVDVFAEIRRRKDHF